MDDLATWGNQPRPDWIEPWRWTGDDVGEIGMNDAAENMQATEELQPAFSLQDHWEYGGYPSSLLAGSINERQSAEAALNRDQPDRIPVAIVASSRYFVLLKVQGRNSYGVRPGL